MISKVYSYHPDSRGGSLIHIEVFSQKGLPSWSVVGLPGRSIREAKERIIAAFLETGIDPRGYKWVINLSPAFQNKDGSLFDLALAVSLWIQMSNQDLPLDFNKTIILGEVSLDGSIKPTPGVMSAIHFAIHEGFNTLLVPQMEGLPRIPQLRIIQIKSLEHLIQLKWTERSPDESRDQVRSNRLAAIDLWNQSTLIRSVDWKSLAEHPHYHDALFFTIVFRFPILLMGHPGVGKTFFVQLVNELLPTLDDEQWIEIAAREENQGNIKPWIDRVPPFYTPQPNVSHAGLLGGGVPFRHGVIGVANHGIVFIDEMLEFPKGFIELLRQVLEEGKLEHYRSQVIQQIEVNTRWVFATNLCPCGSSQSNGCRCKQAQIQQYQSRVSRAILERIYVHFNLNDLQRSPGNSDFSDFNEFYSKLICLEETTLAGQFRLDKATQKKEIIFRSDYSKREIEIRLKLMRSLSIIYSGSLDQDELKAKVEYFRKFYLDF